MENASHDLNVSMPVGDGSFGPQLPTRFDFTLLFEQSILTILPTCLLLVVSPIYVYRLARKPICARRGLLLGVKLAAVLLLLALELASTVLWSLNAFRSRSSLAASLLSCIATLSTGAILYAEHRRLLRSSALLSVYLSVTLLFDIAKARSYLSRPGLETLGTLAIVIATSKLGLLLLVEVPKRSLIRSALFHLSMGPEVTSGFWVRSLFLWLNATLLTGFRNIINVEDLRDIGPEFDSSKLLAVFLMKWSTVDKSSKYCLPKTCFDTLIWPFLAIVIPRLCFTAFKFTQPLLLRTIVQAIGREQMSAEITSSLIGATLLVYLGIMITNAYCRHLFYRFATMLRGQLVSVVFEKTLHLGMTDATKSAAVTLMSTDIDGIVGCLTVLHDVWAGVIELGLAIFLLATLVGGASFLVVVPATISTMISFIAAKRMGPARMAWNQSIQARVAATSGVLPQLKGLKMTGLAPTVAASLQQLRVNEVNKSKDLRVLSIVLFAITSLSSNITPVVVMAGALFWTSASGRLNAAEAFATLSIVALVSSPLQVLLNAFPQFTGLQSCFGRIQRFLLLDDQVDPRTLANAPENNLFDVPEPAAKADSLQSQIELETIASAPSSTDSQPLICLDDVSVTVSGRSDPLLRDVNVQIKNSSLVLVTGPVGSGKSMLLRTLLGETTITKGSIWFSHNSIAYCDQTAWLRNISIRDNIVGETDFDAEWYDTVLQSCLLRDDIENIQQGDEALVGSGGMTLSGGQRQRVTLARAIYSRKRILILDDVFSALDRRTSRAILRNLFAVNGLLRRSRTTIILAAHLFDLTMADSVIVLDSHGNVTERSPMDLKDDNILRQVQESSEEPHTFSDSEREQSSGPEQAPNTATTADSPKADQPNAIPPTKMKQEENMRQRGDPSLYSFYIRSIGIRLFGSWIILVALMAVWEKMPYIFMRLWLDKDPDNNTYFTGFAILGATSFLCSMVMLSLFMMRLVPTSAESLHWMLLDRLMNATLSFLSKTDTGSILNRFSQDMTLVNQVLPAAFSQFFIYFCAVLVELGIIASGAKYAAIMIPFFILALYILQKFYLRTSRQMRHLDLEAKAPLYTQFTETASGIQHIRAFSWQPEVLKKALEKLSYSQKPYYFMFCIQRWLTLVLDFYVLISAVTLVAIALKVPSMSTQSSIGLALLSVMTFSESLASLMNSWIQLETSLGAIARLKTFLSNTPFESDSEGGVGPSVPREWPHSGKIEFRTASARYDHEHTSPPVLKDLSVVIEAGQKVGIIGRTGSGKSTLILSLLRLLEYDGAIIIDGIDISSISCQELRSRITTLPQDAIELAGSVRENLNPEARPALVVDDDAMQEALTRVGIWQHISTNGGLGSSLSSMSLSQGQKQLLCLARAILHNASTGSRIVLIDEATSSVDLDTESRMRVIISTAFAHCTVLSISHRHESLKDMDVVMELDSGQLVGYRMRK